MSSNLTVDTSNTQPTAAALMATYDTVQAAFVTLLRAIRHSDAADARKDALYNAAFAALNDNGSWRAQIAALATVEAAMRAVSNG